MRDRIAIVMSSGGMTCAYSAGVACALAEKLKLTKPDWVIVTSGSAGTGSYYVAGQYEFIRNIWTNLLSSKRFINHLRLNKILDIDFLIDDIFGKQDPLNVDNIKKSRTHLMIAATDYESGKGRYFTNDDDVMEAMRASKAVPIFYNFGRLRSVRINGHRYVDGALSFDLEHNIQKAIELGANKIIAVDNFTNSIIDSDAMIMYSLLVNSHLGRAVRNFVRQQFRHKDKPGSRVIYLRKPKSLHMGPSDNIKGHLDRTFRIGYEDTASDMELRRFLRE